MGINRNSLRLLNHSRNYVDFKSSIMLGRQSLFLTKKELKKFGKSIFGNGNNLPHSENLFKSFGAEIIDSLDVSNYEGANIIHDLNKSLPENLKNKYTVVFDGGSLEHVFNIPVALQNCMDLLQVGGHFISITPTNNFLGHGFYQFSPELFYSVFQEKYGFEMVQMIFFIDNKYTSFYKVADPKIVKDRVILSNSYPSYLFIIAKKISNITDKVLNPQQSDYQNEKWRTSGDKNRINKMRFFKRKFMQFLPFLNLLSQRGISKKDYFQKIKI